MLQHKVTPVITVIGMEGCTDDGSGFIQRLWQNANSRFSEIAHMADMTDDGSPKAIWGAMSSMDRSNAPWENGFSRGLYLAGCQCRPGAKAPEGWSKWEIPATEWVVYPADHPDCFAEGLRLLEAEGLSMCGAACDYTDLSSNQSYTLYPIRRL